MIAIPNTEIPDDAVNVELAFRDEDGYIVWHMFDIPLIEIVTCGECKHLEVINKAPIYAHCHKWNYDFELWKEDTRTNFCSWGERRTDEKL